MNTHQPKTSGLMRDTDPMSTGQVGVAVQAFVLDPAKQQVPFSLSAASKVFKVGTGADFDITGFMALQITPSVSNLTAWFNSDTTKTFTIFGGQANIIVIHRSVTQITINGTDARIEVGGM